MRITLISIVLSVCLLAGPAIASPPDQSSSDGKEAKPEAAEKICKYVTDGMGSRRKKRLCLTEQEWIDFNRGQ